ncbi:30S ribosome-binding factor RbfA [Schlesneria sp.]|uniref:30S ribosome-binding factor RbfA n=1 Tax=Schlesneria sp. TaxID=2762018 RepID=UPI002EECA721
MNTRRVAKAAEAIRESVSMTILVGLRDPRVKNVTVLRAEVSGDLRNAKVYVSIMGDAKAQSLTMHGLESARGYIQAKVADRLQTKNTPVLKFVLDPGVKFSAETSQTLRQVMPDENGVAGAVDSEESEFDSSTAESDDDEGDDDESDTDDVDDESESGSADLR